MSENKRVLKIKCPYCHAKIFRYMKIGKGYIHHCWKNRIIVNYSIKDGINIKCPDCGKIIGKDKGKFIKMKIIRGL